MATVKYAVYNLNEVMKWLHCTNSVQFFQVILLYQHILIILYLSIKIFEEKLKFNS